MLVPIAVAAPSQPVHNDSLFKVFSELAANLPKQPAEGEVWLMVYDFKALSQQPDMKWPIIQKLESKIHFHAACSRMEDHDLSPMPRLSWNLHGASAP